MQPDYNAASMNPWRAPIGCMPIECREGLAMYLDPASADGKDYRMFGEKLGLFPQKVKALRANTIGSSVTVAILDLCKDLPIWHLKRALEEMQVTGVQVIIHYLPQIHRNFLQQQRLPLTHARDGIMNTETSCTCPQCQQQCHHHNLTTLSTPSLQPNIPPHQSWPVCPPSYRSANHHRGNTQHTMEASGAYRDSPVDVQQSNGCGGYRPNFDNYWQEDGFYFLQGNISSLTHLKTPVRDSEVYDQEDTCGCMGLQNVGNGIVSLKAEHSGSSAHPIIDIAKSRFPVNQTRHQLPLHKEHIPEGAVQQTLKSIECIPCATTVQLHPPAVPPDERMGAADHVRGHPQTRHLSPNPCDFYLNDNAYQEQVRDTGCQEQVRDTGCQEQVRDTAYQEQVRDTGCQGHIRDTNVRDTGYQESVCQRLPPKFVFVSGGQSNNKEEHQREVNALCSELSDAGITVIAHLEARVRLYSLDSTDLRDSLQKSLRETVEETLMECFKKATSVIIVISPGYKSFVDKDNNEPQPTNHQLHSRLLYTKMLTEYTENKSKNKRFFPVKLAALKTDQKHLPDWLKPTIHYTFPSRRSELISHLVK